MRDTGVRHLFSQITRWPTPCSARVRCRPMKPLPPNNRTVIAPRDPVLQLSPKAWMLLNPTCAAALALALQHPSANDLRSFDHPAPTSPLSPDERDRHGFRRLGPTPHKRPRRLGGSLVTRPKTSNGGSAQQRTGLCSARPTPGTSPQHVRQQHRRERSQPAAHVRPSEGN